MPEPKVNKLLSQPEFIRMMQEVWDRLPESVRRKHKHVEGFLQTPESSRYATKLVEKDLQRLIGSSSRMEELVGRALKVTAAENDEASFAIPLIVTDSAGNDFAVSLKGAVDNMPVVLDCRSAIASDDNGLHRYKHPVTGEEIVVYNPKRDKSGEESNSGALFSGRLPMSHVFSALLPQTLFPESGVQVKLLSRIKVKNDRRFDPDEVYAGYAVKPLAGKNWMRLGHLAAIEGFAARSGANGSVYIHGADDEIIANYKISFLKNMISGLRRIHYTLRGLGAVADLLDGAMINMDSGEVVLNPGTHTIALDGGLFASEDGVILDHGVDEPMLNPNDEFIPGIAARVLADSHLIRTASFVVNKYGHQKYDINVPITALVMRQMIGDMGLTQTWVRMRQYPNVSPAEYAAFYDYIFGHIDKKIGLWTQLRATMADGDSLANATFTSDVLSANFDSFLHAYRAQVGTLILPPEIAEDPVAEEAYEKALSMIDESLHDDNNLRGWHDLFETYYQKNGMNQLPMFFAMKVPLLMLESRWGDSGKSFFELAQKRIGEFDPRKDALSWEAFGEEVRKIEKPDDDPDDDGGPRGDHLDDGIEAELGMGQVLQFPFGGRAGTSALRSSMWLRSAGRMLKVAR